MGKHTARDMFQKVFQIRTSKVARFTWTLHTVVWGFMVLVLDQLLSQRLQPYVKQQT